MIDNNLSLKIERYKNSSTGFIFKYKFVWLCEDNVVLESNHYYGSPEKALEAARACMERIVYDTRPEYGFFI